MSLALSIHRLRPMKSKATCNRSHMTDTSLAPPTYTLSSINISPARLLITHHLHIVDPRLLQNVCDDITSATNHLTCTQYTLYTHAHLPAPLYTHTHTCQPHYTHTHAHLPAPTIHTHAHLPAPLYTHTPTCQPPRDEHGVLGILELTSSLADSFLGL